MQPPGPQPRLSLLALISFIVAVISPLGICFCYPTLVGSAIALVLAHIALFRIWRSEGQQWGSVWAILGLVIAYPLFGLGMVWIMLPPRPRIPSTPPSVAQSRLSEAEHKIIGDSDGVAHGNSPRAKELAQKFSSEMKELRDELFTESKTKLKLSGGNFVVFCQLEKKRCAFLVHAPDLRHFTDEAEQSLAELAWAVGKSVASEELEDGDQLGVGLKGVLFYSAVMTGKIGVGQEPHTTKEKENLIRFFEPEPEMATTPQEGQPEESAE